MTGLHVEPWFLWPTLPAMTDEEAEEWREAELEAEERAQEELQHARMVFAGRG